MADNESWISEFDINGLNLIDVSAEDDSLLFSSFPDPTNYEFSDTDKDEGALNLFRDIHSCDEEILVSTLERKEQVFQPHESPKPQKIFKYNLRKSLAWDKAFFTNAGVLEPDELSDMIESNHMGERKILVTIQEDVNRSTESISTLQSDCTVETSQDFVLFEDVRASIQRSAISSDTATPEIKSKHLGATEASPSPTPSTLDDPGSQDKMEPNAIRKWPSIRAQGLRKVKKQPIATKEHNTSISRPQNGLSKTTGASIDVKKAKQEKNLKLAGGKEPLAHRIPVSRSARPIVTKPTVPFKSSMRSSVVSKNELTSSCSSLESCTTILSSASMKSSRDLLKQKKDQSLSIAPCSLGNGSTVRAASKSIGQPKVPPLSASRVYNSKLSSNAFSSSVDWSSESLRASRPNKVAKGNKKIFPGARGPGIVGTSQTLKPLNISNDVSAVQDDLTPDKQGSVVNGSTVRSSSMIKSTGLRVPSPKIGYFDGARSSIARTPTGSFTGQRSGLGKNVSRTPKESSSSRFSPLVQASTNSKAQVSPVSSSPRLITASPKLTNRMYTKVSEKSNSQGNEMDSNIAR